MIQSFSPAPQRGFHGLCLLLLITLSLMQSACGGGGGGGSSPTVTPVQHLTLDVQPQDQTVVEGKAVRLSVSASNASSYQWYRGVGSTWTAIDGATTASYTIDTAPASLDGTQFRVTVKGAGAELTSSAVTVRITPLVLPPGIDIPPASITVADGQDASFHVTAQGSTLSYQWQTSKDGGTSWLNAADGTSASWTWRIVALADHGAMVRVQVGNAAGQLASAAATLTVKPAPQAPSFLTAPVNVSVTEGQSATFTTTAIGTPAPTLRWQSWSSGGWSDIPNATNSSYTTPLTTSSDNGKGFRVTATNDSGQVISPAVYLNVTATTFAPWFELQPYDSLVFANSWASFSVRANGVPAPTLQWQISTDFGASWSNINGATAASYTTGTLGLAANGNQYRVVATNSKGSVNSATAALTVMPYAPLITVQPASQDVVAPQGVTLRVGANAAPAPTYQWQTLVGSTWQDIPGAQASSYSLATTDVLVDDGRLFRALVSNASGTTVSDAVALRVSPRPTVGACASGWCWTNALPQGNTLFAAAQPSSSVQVAVGHLGTIVRSGDAGRSWQSVASGTRHHLKGLAFESALIGFAVGDAGTILRTLDGGLNWFAIGSGISQALVAVSASSSGMVVAVGDGGVIVRSVDHGASWSPVSSGTGENLRTVAFAGTSTVLAFGSNSTALRSTDAGMSWSALSLYPFDGYNVAFINAADGVVAGSTGILWTSDSGFSWHSGSGLFGAPGLYARVIYQAADMITVVDGVRQTISADGGRSWGTAVNPNGYRLGALDANSTGFMVGYGGNVTEINRGSTGKRFGLVDQDISALAFSGSSNGLAVTRIRYAGGSAAVLRTQDGGQSWAAAGASNTSQSLTGVAYVQTGTAIAVSSGGSIIRSTDNGGTWTSVHEVGAPIMAVAFNGGQIGIAVGDSPIGYNGTSAIVRRSTDGGQTWSVVTHNGYGVLNATFANATLAIAVGKRGEMSRSSDAGASWSFVATGTNSHLYGVAASPDATTVLAVGQAGLILRSSDGGVTMNTIASGTTNDLYGVRFVSATKVFAYGKEGTLLFSSDKGQTWTTLPVVAFQDLLALHGIDENTLVLGGANGALLRSTSGGQ